MTFPTKAAMLLGLAACAMARPAAAQTQQDIAILHIAAANQLGLLEYCAAHHSVDDDVVEMQRTMMMMLPPMQIQGATQAEALGRQGVALVNNQQLPMSEAAKHFKTTEDKMCKNLATMVVNLAKNPGGK
jgi:hypothetical protein